MQSINDLALYHLPLDEPALWGDPYPYFAAARERHPWLARSPYGYVVHEYSAMKELTAMDDKLRASLDVVTGLLNARETRWGYFLEHGLLGLSGSEPDRIRKTVEAAFKPRSIAAHRDRMRISISRLLDEWAPKEGFDFADFAARYPITVMFGLIGASAAKLPSVLDSLEALGLGLSLNPSLLPSLEASYDVLYEFVDELICERRQSREHPGDLLDELIGVNDRGELDDLELRNMLIFLFAGGYDTTKNMLTLSVYHMLDHPEIWARCATDRNYCISVVEECLRLTGVGTAMRLAKEDFVYRDVFIPAETVIQLPHAVAGRDPDSFDNPSSFDPERVHRNRHLTFGRGMHICLGQHLARLQLEEGIHLIAQRLLRPQLTGEVTWRPFSGVWGIRSLPITFEPGPVEARIS